MEYMTDQVKNSAKVEAMIGAGIITLITNFVIQHTLEGTEMPGWAILVLLMLLISFFGVRVLAFMQYFLEHEVFYRGKRVDAELQDIQLKSQIQKLALEVRLKEFEVMMKGAVA